MSEPIIPDDALDTHIGVLGRTGSGKTYTGRGLVERLLDADRQVVIIDPTSAWWGLRSEYDIPIFGGPHGDVAITDDSGEAVAETILANTTSAIIDLSLLARDSHAAMRRFMSKLIARLKDRDNGALWLVVDEADEFMPQVLPRDMTRLFGDLKWIVRRGRIAGWRVMMITQRPQDIAKAMLTQIGTLVAHRLTAPQDRKAIEAWVEGNAEDGQAKEVLSTLSTLETGEAWVWAPDVDLLARAKMPPIRSFDSSATPDAGTGKVEQPDLAQIDLSAIKATLEKQGENHCAGAGKKVSSLPALDNSAEILKRDKRIAELGQELAALQVAYDRRGNDMIEQQTKIDASRSILNRLSSCLAGDPPPTMPITKSEIPAQGGGGPQREQGHVAAEDRGSGPGAAAPRERAPAKPQRASGDGAGQGVTAGETVLNVSAKKMLEMLERIAPARVTWPSLAAMIGNKPRGGNFNAARKGMRESGLIIEEADTIRSAADPKQGMTRDQALSLWKEVLTNPAPQMIDALDLQRLSKQELGPFIGIKASGGYFNTGVAQLIRNGVAVDVGGVLELASPLPGESQ